jgi:hypothetical protein
MTPPQTLSDLESLFRELASLTAETDLAEEWLAGAYDTVERASLHSDPRHRACAAGLCALFPDSFRPNDRNSMVRTLLGDPDPLVRTEAACAAGDLADEGARDGLQAILQTSDPQEQFEAALALAILGDSSGRSTLEAALRQPRLRMDACRALGRLRDPSAVPALEKLVHRWFLPWPERLEGYAALLDLGQTELASAYILQRTRSRNPYERAFALSLVGNRRIEAGYAILVDVARDSQDRWHDLAVQSLRDLKRPESSPASHLLQKP